GVSKGFRRYPCVKITAPVRLDDGKWSCQASTGCRPIRRVCRISCTVGLSTQQCFLLRACELPSDYHSPGRRGCLRSCARPYPPCRENSYEASRETGT